METGEMGRVVVEARIDNIKDKWEVETGQRASADARSVTIPDALVDTGATGLNIPSRFIQQLGLSKIRERRIRTANGPRSASVYEAVRLTIRGRDCIVDVTELDDDVAVLIGQIPLEWLDLVVDLRNQKVIGNPAHDGKWVIEAYSAI